MPTVAEDEAALSPGDVVLFGGYNQQSYAHSGIWAGNDQIWDASGSPGSVREVTFEELMSTYNNAYQGAMDYNALSQTTPPKFSITTTSLPAATIGKKYEGGQLTATGGTTPYKWKVSGLPRGLKAYAKTGLIKGTVKSSKKHPQAAGSYPVKVTATDSANGAGNGVAHPQTQRCFVESADGTGSHLPDGPIVSAQHGSPRRQSGSRGAPSQ